MKYEIKGTPMPVVECQLERGESMICEGGSMAWMSSNMEMQTTGGGVGKMFSKMFSGENMFHNTYTAQGGEGYIAFASSFPGNIIVADIAPGKSVIAQKGAFLAGTSGVERTIHFKKKLGAGLFAGEGFIMQKISGNGTVFLELDGSIEVKELAAGETIIVDTGYVALMDESCTMDIQSVAGVKNALLGGEGLFNTVVTGPGRVWLQTMPSSRVAEVIRRYIPVQSSN